MLNAAAFAAPAGVFIGLSTSTPTDAGANVTEPAGSDGYARVDVEGAWTETGAGTRIFDNDATISWGPAVNNNWGTITHVVFYTALTGGTYLGAIALTSSQAINIGGTAQAAAAAIQLDATGV